MFLRLPVMTVSTKGTAMAISMAMAKVPMDWGCMDRMPGRPPTPMEFAVEEVMTEKAPAIPEPIMAQMKGKLYFRLTPNMAGSVTPR